MTLATESAVERLGLPKLFSEESYKFDPTSGTVTNIGNTRVVYLSSDIIRGVYNALEYEAGEAWRLILRNCGYIWGKRVAANLDRELALLHKTKQAELAVADYVRFIETYFRYNGWGVMKLDLEYAASHGVIGAHLQNSIWESVLSDVNGFVDMMIEGLLRALFEYISGRELGCVQIASKKAGAESTEFVITAADRAEEVESMVEGGASRESIYEKLMA